MKSNATVQIPPIFTVNNICSSFLVEVAVKVYNFTSAASKNLSLWESALGLAYWPMLVGILSQGVTEMPVCILERVAFFIVTMNINVKQESRAIAGELRDASVNFEKYRILQRHRRAFFTARQHSLLCRALY